MVFLRDAFPPQPCPPVDDPFAPRALVPASVKAAGGPVAAAQLTVADAFHQLDAGSLLRVGAEPSVRGGGLRAGRFHGSKRGLVLQGYTFVPGFPVIGLVKPSGTVVLRVRRGVLRFAEDGSVTGKLRGKEVVAQGTLQRRSLARELAGD